MVTSGNFVTSGENRMSAAACTMFIGWRLISTSIGASGAVIASLPDEPMCRHTTVPSSEHARHTGSQWSVWKLGRPSGTGFSGNVIAWQPFFATRRTSSPIACGSQIGGIASGMNRSGAYPHHSSMCQSLYGAAERERGVLVFELAEQAAREAGQRREVERAEQTVGRHVEHALVHVVGALAQLVEARRVHPVLLGRPAGDGVEPDVRDVEVEELPRVGAVGAVLDPRRDVLVLRGQVVLEHVGRLDHVVVDAHEDEIFEVHGPSIRVRR